MKEYYTAGEVLKDLNKIIKQKQKLSMSLSDINKRGKLDDKEEYLRRLYMRF